MPNRPLWRAPTKEAITQANAVLAVQRAQLADMPGKLIVQELERRGYTIVEVSIDGPMLVIARRKAAEMLDDMQQEAAGQTMGYARLVYRGRGKPLPYPLDEDASELGGGEDGVSEEAPELTARPDYGSHVCVDGKVKPIDWLLCSRCPSSRPPLGDGDEGGGPLPFDGGDRRE